jgi:hypothetical protein
MGCAPCAFNNIELLPIKKKMLSDINKGVQEGASRPYYTNGNGQTLDSSVTMGRRP